MKPAPPIARSARNFVVLVLVACALDVAIAWALMRIAR